MSLFDLDSWQEVFATLRKNRLRTALTGLGVFIGIFLLLVMVGFSVSLESGIRRALDGFANNAVFAWGQRTSVAYDGLPVNRQVKFDNRDIEAMRRVDGIQYLAPRNQIGGFMQGSNIRYGVRSGSFQVAGDFPEFQHVQTPRMKAGRYLNQRDIDERRKICVIGTGVSDQLFRAKSIDDGGDGGPDVDPIGKFIEAQGVYFEVVGVFGSRQSGQEGDQAANTVEIPFTTFQQAFNAGDRVDWFAVAGYDNIAAEQLEANIVRMLSDRHKISPADTEAIGRFNAGKEFKKMTSLFSIIGFVMWFAGIMTLGAGVVGVANIMLISVRERTKEIGVRKALGATPSVIVRMVVTEAIVLTSIAGYLGIMTAIDILEIVGYMLEKFGGDKLPFGPPSLSLPIAITAATIIAIFGALAGVIPAYHAAAIQPVEALRTE